MSTSKHDHGYDLTRMVGAVEGQGSQTALTLSGVMEFHDILKAVRTACKDISDREQSAPRPKPASARRKVSRPVRVRSSVPAIA